MEAEKVTEKEFKEFIENINECARKFGMELIHKDDVTEDTKIIYSEIFSASKKGRPHVREDLKRRLHAVFETDMEE